MKGTLKILSFVVLLFAFAKGLYAQEATTQGTDFWLSFGLNGVSTANELNLQIRVATGNVGATVKFTYTESGASNTVSIPAGTVYTYPLDATEKGRVYSNNTGKSDKSLHIESSVPVSAYALNQQVFTTDATNVLPVTGLGTEYYHISYKSHNFNALKDGYTLVAIANNTDIYANGTLVTTLNRGQVYSAYFPDTDLTGMFIRSTQPVAYFVTNQTVLTPMDVFAGDCLYQQLVPVSKWGRNFLVPVTHRGVERIRIVASQDGTEINQTGGVIKTDNGGFGQNSLYLNKGQFVELETALYSCGCYITSNHPVGVCSYLTGGNYSRLIDSKGDPAMAWVPPIEQSINGVLIAPFIPSGISELEDHYVVIVTSTSTKNHTSMKIGTNSATTLTGLSWCDNTTSGYSFCSLQLTNKDESYFFSNPYGLIIMGYGLGHAESYYYLSGAALRDLRDLDAAFYINNIRYQYLNNSVLCDTVVNFQAILQNAQTFIPGYLRWYIDGILQSAYTDVWEWSKSLSIGKHTVVARVVNMDSQTIELSTTFNVSIARYDTIKATICLGKSYNQHGFDLTPTTAGPKTEEKSFGREGQCDSVIILQLNVLPSYYDTITATICMGETYSEFGFNETPTMAGFYTYPHPNTNTTALGCDSITVLHLTVNPVYEDDVFAKIYEGEYYTIGNELFYEHGNYIALLQSKTGCDSIINLNLWVVPFPHYTAFSPFNKDGINDYFMSGLKIQVFNRNGTLIYETKTEEQKRLGWDGRNNKGQEIEPGMYFYILYNSNERPRIRSSVEVLKRY